jgi:uncharacterized protein (TIGR01777 family)
MKIVIAGGTGFLGRPLAQSLAADGHIVIVLSRSGIGRAAVERPGTVTTVRWTPDGTTGAWGAAVEGAGGVVNLAGESIGGKRWSAAQKAAIRDSRIEATRSLVAAIDGAMARPAVLVSGSAIGYYGPHGDEPLDEQAPPGSDFLAQVCVEWEAEARRAESAGVRVAFVRTGLVLERDGGALAKMLRPFKLFVGGRLGSGRQYMSWIHRHDWIALVKWITETGTAAGPFNGTAPAPVTNAEFTRALARALARPAILPAPAFALKIALGEMAEPLVLTGQRVLPARAREMEFRFRYTDIHDALASIVT